MALPNPALTYKTQGVLTAAPEELTLMLYSGCLRYMKQGVAAIDSSNIEEANNALTRAQDIICELISSLDLTYQVALNLLSLYDYFYHLLVEANLRKDARGVITCIEMMTELRDTWTEAVRMSRVR